MQITSIRVLYVTDKNEAFENNGQLGHVWQYGTNEL